MVTFTFKTREEFNKASKILKDSIDQIGTKHFDHGEQPEERTIRIQDPENAKIVQGLFSKKGLKDFGVINEPSKTPIVCVASALRCLCKDLKNERPKSE